mgnify:CR=1 FL=1
MDQLRIGFVGCGFMGQLAHIANYATMPEVHMSALADPRPQTRELVARRYDIEQVYATHEELLEKGNVDAVVAVLPYQFHHVVVPRVLSSGKPLLTERPISVNRSQAERFVELADQQGVIYQVGYMKRCDPATRRMKEFIADWRNTQEFGRLRYFRVSMPPGDWLMNISGLLGLSDQPEGDELAHEPFPEHLQGQTLEEYRAFVNFYLHQVNLIRYLLAEDFTVQYVDHAGTVMIARSRSGVTIALEMDTYHVRNEWHEFYTACFEKGKMSLALPAPMARQRCGQLRIYRNTIQGASYEQPMLEPLWCMQEQARMFVQAVNGDIPNVSPASEAVRDLEIADAVIQKHREAQEQMP